MGIQAPIISDASKRMLWIDDRVSIHSNLISKLRNLGVYVATAESVETAVSALEASQFDQILLDAMLGHESALPRIPEILLVADGARLSVCSGFMYRDFLQGERISVEKITGVTIETIDKAVLPDPDEPKMIENFVRNLFSSHEIQAEGLLPETKITPLSLSYLEYARLRLEDKMSWLDRTAPIVESIAEKYFDDGYVYLLFCGSIEPQFAVEEFGEIPSEDQIIELAKRVGFAPLAIHNIGTVDDIPSACCERNGLRSYPILTLSASSGEYVEVHFDNGASQSLMSYEWYGEKGWIPYARNPALIRVGEMLLKGVRYKLEDFEFVDATGASRRSDFSAYYIMQWDKCRLAVRCGPTCKNDWPADAKSDGFCRFRTGLLGRTVPRDELKISFITDFSVGGITFFGGAP